MTRHRLARTILLALACAPLAAAAPAEARTLTTETVTAAKAVKRDCATRQLRGGSGYDRVLLRAPASGWIRATLTGARGDWDLAVFDRATGRRVAASTARGTSEVAAGLVTTGDPLAVQACRRSGRGDRARLAVESIALGQTSKPVRLSLVRIAVPNEERKHELNELGLDLTEHGGKGFVEAVLYGTADAEKLRKHNFVFTTEIADLTAHGMADRAKDRAYARRVRSTGLPSGRNSYRDLADYTSEMKKLAEDNPGLVRPLTLPHKTWEGRTVEGIEISTNVNKLGDGKPVFLNMGVHHAREWPSGEMSMEFAHDLVKGYRDGDARTRRILDSVRVIVVPIVNPDGFNISRTAGKALGAGGGRGHTCPQQVPQEVYDEIQNEVGDSCPSLWETANHATVWEYQRKNCRRADDDESGSCYQPGIGLAQFGVDPNRNYGAFWGGPGTSTDPTALTYHGPGPFSEPETQNVKELVSGRQVTVLITNHTFSNLILRPPGIAARGLAPDEELLKQLGDSMAEENGYSSQFGYQLYDTTGTTEDWSYASTGGLGYTFEVGPEHFHPPFAETVLEYTGGTKAAPTGGGNREAYFKAAEAAADSRTHSLIRGRAPAGVTLEITKSFETKTMKDQDEDGSPDTFPETLTSSLSPSRAGAFEWHVNPSTRPSVVKGFSRPATGPPSEPIEFTGAAGPEARPCASFDTKNKDCFNDHPFEVQGAPFDNASAAIDVTWNAGGDWDFKVFRDTDGDGTSFKNNGTEEEEKIGQSGEFVPHERTTLGEPLLAPGKYVVRVINYAAVEPYNGTVTFSGPAPYEAPMTEAWTLTCAKDGRTLGTTQVIVHRGQAVDVGNPCAGRSRTVASPAPTSDGAAPGGEAGSGGEQAVRGHRRAQGTLRISRRAARVTRSGQARVAVRCSDAGPCSGLLRLVKGGRALGSGRYSVAAGRSALVVVRISRSARRSVADARRGVAVTAVAGAARQRLRLLAARN